MCMYVLHTVGMVLLHALQGAIDSLALQSCLVVVCLVVSDLAVRQPHCKSLSVCLSWFYWGPFDEVT